MKHAMVTVLFIAVLYTSQAFANSDLAAFNGDDWKTSTSSQKDSMVSGFFLAMNYIAVNASQGQTFEGVGSDESSKLLLRVFGKKELKFTKNEVKKILNSKGLAFDETLETYRIVNISNDQIVAGLDEFYKDFRNIQIRLPDAIYYVRKQITGSDQEELEVTANYLRSPVRELSKLIYKDKNGKSAFAPFP